MSTWWNGWSSSRDLPIGIRHNCSEKSGYYQTTLLVETSSKLECFAVANWKLFSTFSLKSPKNGLKNHWALLHKRRNSGISSQSDNISLFKSKISRNKKLKNTLSSRLSIHIVHIFKRFPNEVLSICC